MDIELTPKTFKKLERGMQSMLTHAYQEYLRNPTSPHPVYPHKFGHEPLFGSLLRAGGAFKIAMSVSGRNPVYGYRLTDEAIEAMKSIIKVWGERT